MGWYKRANDKPQRYQDELSDWFDSTLTEPQRKEISRDAPRTEPVVLTLYRGFDADLNALQKSGNQYILNTDRSDQGVLWFSCPNFQNNALETATRGQYLLTYPLNAVRHIETIHYSDGSTYNNIPDAIHEQAQPTENCRFHAGYELPDGWAFSYKTQKYIICFQPLRIDPGMISRHQREE